MAISNERIVGIAGDDVLLRVRADVVSGRKRVTRVQAGGFIGRFLQHVLPAWFKRIRRYGLLSPARKQVALAAACTALDVPAPQADVIESVAAFLRRVAQKEHFRCPHCRIGEFRVVATLLPQRDRPRLRAPPG